MKPRQLTYAVQPVLIDEELRWYLVFQFDTTLPDKWVIYTWWEEPTSKEVEEIMDACFASIRFYQSAADIKNGRFEVTKVTNV